MTLLGPTVVFTPPSSEDQVRDTLARKSEQLAALASTYRYKPPAIPAPAALEGVTESLDELLDATSVEVEPYADDLSEAFELLRNVADKIVDDRADRSAAA